MIVPARLELVREGLPSGFVGHSIVGMGYGKRANSNGLSQSVAERCCGALG